MSTEKHEDDRTNLFPKVELKMSATIMLFSFCHKIIYSKIEIEATLN